MAKSNDLLDSRIILNEKDLLTIWNDKDLVKPKFIIFDLDFTLWPYFANRYYRQPFKINKNIITDSTNKKVTYFKDIPKILKTLKEDCFKNDEKLAIASRSADRKTIQAMLELSFKFPILNLILIFFINFKVF
jgi:magnesium-dependent phosphatase-1